MIFSRTAHLFSENETVPKSSLTKTPAKRALRSNSIISEDGPVSNPRKRTTRSASTQDSPSDVGEIKTEPVTPSRKKPAPRSRKLLNKENEDEEKSNNRKSLHTITIVEETEVTSTEHSEDAEKIEAKSVHKNEMINDSDDSDQPIRTPKKRNSRIIESISDGENETNLNIASTVQQTVAIPSVDPIVIQRTEEKKLSSPEPMDIDESYSIDSEAQNNENVSVAETNNGIIELVTTSTTSDGIDSTTDVTVDRIPQSEISISDNSTTLIQVNVTSSDTLSNDTENKVKPMEYMDLTNDSSDEENDIKSPKSPQKSIETTEKSKDDVDKVKTPTARMSNVGSDASLVQMKSNEQLISTENTPKTKIASSPKPFDSMNVTEIVNESDISTPVALVASKQQNPVKAKELKPVEKSNSYPQTAKNLDVTLNRSSSLENLGSTVNVEIIASLQEKYGETPTHMKKKSPNEDSATKRITPKSPKIKTPATPKKSHLTRATESDIEADKDIPKEKSPKKQSIFDTPKITRKGITDLITPKPTSIEQTKIEPNQAMNSTSEALEKSSPKSEQLKAPDELSKSISTPNTIDGLSPKQTAKKSSSKHLEWRTIGSNLSSPLSMSTIKTPNMNDTITQTVNLNAEINKIIADLGTPTPSQEVEKQFEQIAAVTSELNSTKISENSENVETHQSESEVKSIESPAKNSTEMDQVDTRMSNDDIGSAVPRNIHNDDEASTSESNLEGNVPDDINKNSNKSVKILTPKIDPKKESLSRVATPYPAENSVEKENKKGM